MIFVAVMWFMCVVFPVSVPVCLCAATVKVEQASLTGESESAMKDVHTYVHPTAFYNSVLFSVVRPLRPLSPMSDGCVGRLMGITCEYYCVLFFCSLREDTDITGKHNLLFMSTGIVGGRAKSVVYAVRVCVRMRVD